MEDDLMELASLLLGKTKAVLIFTSSNRLETRTNTTPCQSVLEAKVPKHISKRIMKASLTVRYTSTSLWTKLIRIFVLASLEDLIRHGLYALRETLQQDKELTIQNTSIGILGSASDDEKKPAPAGAFRILENEEILPFLTKFQLAKAMGSADVQMSG